MKTIEQIYSEYEAAIYPLGLLPNQAMQVRAAFMAGAAHILQSMDDVAQLSDDDGVKVLEALHTEMGEIVQGIVDGTARRNS